MRVRKDCDLSAAARSTAVEHPQKTCITIMLDRDVIAAFRTRAKDTGSGQQTATIKALRKYLANPESLKRPRSCNTRASPKHSLYSLTRSLICCIKSLPAPTPLW